MRFSKMEYVMYTLFMSELALYRKYRPSSFDDVIGQDHIVRALSAALSKGAVAHAYLLPGSRGIGKTTIARIIAKEIGTSDNDIVEIDGASNRKIEDVRDLRENVRTLPFDSKYKVYIIDEVHMLTKEAWNALLKTLEEPPAHVVFILATTELEKVPETIVSRCQTFTLKKPTETILKDVVRDIAKKEGCALASGADELVATLGDGSFRDTIGILQKVLSIKEKGDKKISLAAVEEITGAPSGTLVNDYISAIADSDIAKGLAVVEKANAQNLEMKVFIKLILQRFRYALMLRYAYNDMASSIAERIGENDFAFLSEIAKKKPETIVSSSLEILLECAQLSKSAFVPSLPLELALWKILGAADSA